MDQVAHLEDLTSDMVRHLFQLLRLFGIFELVFVLSLAEQIGQ